MKNVTGPCDFKVGPGRRFRSGELKSGELLTIGIGMILTVDRKHCFFVCKRPYYVVYGCFFSALLFKSVFPLPFLKLNLIQLKSLIL